MARHPARGVPPCRHSITQELIDSSISFDRAAHERLLRIPAATGQPRHQRFCVMNNNHTVPRYRREGIVQPVVGTFLHQRTTSVVGEFDIAASAYRCPPPPTSPSPRDSPAQRTTKRSKPIKPRVTAFQAPYSTNTGWKKGSKMPSCLSSIRPISEQQTRRSECRQRVRKSEAVARPRTAAVHTVYLTVFRLDAHSPPVDGRQAP